MRLAVWIGVMLAALAFCAAAGCAVPVAAVGAAAALTLRPRAAFAAAGLVWLAGQIWQVTAMGYALDGSALLWGGALLALSLACVAAPVGLAGVVRRAPAPVIWAGAFTLAFVVYEGGLFGISLLLAGRTGLFAPALLASALAVNATVFGVLAAASWLRPTATTRAAAVEA
jgi:hypothetical protein